MELQKLLVTFGGIDRKVFIPPQGEVAESDLQHSFSIAMLAWFLAPHFPHLNSSRLIELCMAHDMLEVYCGDTFSFDEQAVSGQKALEARAIAALKENWADFLDISTKSLHRYKQTSKSFKSIQSEKIIEMSEVTKVGLDVFGEMEKFKLWLETPNFSLGNFKPLEFYWS